MPTIFTETPYESHIQAVFLKAQLALAQMINGTQAFRVLLFGVLAWAMVLSFIKMAAHHHRAGSVFVHVVYRIALVFFAMSLLRWQNSSVQWTAPHGAAWTSMNGVSRDNRYNGSINGQTPGLWGYLLVYESMNGVGQLMVNAANSAFGSGASPADQVFLMKELARMSSMALSSDTHRALEALNAQCSATTTGKVVGSNTSLYELYDMDLPGCLDMWNTFDTNAMQDARALKDKYPDYVWRKIHLSLSNNFGFSSESQNENIGLANAIVASARNQFGTQNYGSRETNMGSLSANQAATLSTNSDRFMEEQSKGLLTGWIANVGDFVSNWWWGGNFQQAARKAEAANKFNMIGPMIPAARGLIQGMLSMLFVLAAYSIGFGTWRFMGAWVMAQASFCMYRPAAQLAFNAATYFTQQASLAKSIGNLVNQPYVLGGALLMQQEVAELQTVYICFEIGCFVVFTLGAIGAFRAVSTITSGAGLALAGQAERGLGALMSRGGGQGTEVQVNVASVAGGGGGPGGAGSSGPRYNDDNGGGGGGVPVAPAAARRAPAWDAEPTGAAQSGGLAMITPAVASSPGAAAPAVQSPAPVAGAGQAGGASGAAAA